MRLTKSFELSDYKTNKKILIYGGLYENCGIWSRKMGRDGISEITAVNGIE